MTPFEFVTSPRIIFGRGALAAGLKEARTFGLKALLLKSSSGASSETVVNFCRESGIQYVEFPVDHEPSVELVQKITAYSRAEKCDFVIAFGGGSVMDAGKAASVMMTNPGDLLDYLEVVGKNQPLTHPAAPCVAIPTTAGTGAEVTRNAVLSVPDQRIKVSLRSNFLFPRLAVVDPELTLSLPPHVTAYTGLDALTQVIEPFTSLKRNPMMDVICRDGITRSARSLVAAYIDGNNTEAREDLSLTSLYGGLALTNAGLGAVHGFAAPVGGMFDAPHGAICGVLLPRVVKTNITALERRDHQNPVLDRYTEIARILTGRPTAERADGVNWLERLVKDLQVPSLSTYGIKSEDFSMIVDKAQKASSMKANPVELTRDELTQILEDAL